jgi:hypothetical protein
MKRYYHGKDKDANKKWRDLWLQGYHYAETYCNDNNACYTECRMEFQGVSQDMSYGDPLVADALYEGMMDYYENGMTALDKKVKNAKRR